MRAVTHEYGDGRPAELVVALVNNMAPAARCITERQFSGLLSAASRIRNISVGLLAVETPPGSGREALRELRDARPDALIVTGAEPKGASLTEEPLWPVLAHLADWAADHTVSSIWSCMAAHMAVYQLDGISRRPMPQKLSGVFACTKLTEHFLLGRTPASWATPHSRQNGLDEMELRRKGYSVLSHGGPRVGPDCFVKEVRGSLFLMLQGHPEYDPDSLLGEYRRDVRRFLAGQRDGYPVVPEGCLGDEATAALALLRRQAGRVPDATVLAAVDAAIAVRPKQDWHRQAVGLFTNWLSYLARQKAAREALAKWRVPQRRLAS